MQALETLVPPLPRQVRHLEARRAVRTDERGISVPHVQATGTENVQDKVSDWELPMILNCESESSRIRRIPIEYVSEIPCMRVETESDLLFGPGPTMIYMMQQLQYPGLDQCPGYTRIY